MRRYFAYRLNIATRKKEAVGCIVERRRTERQMRQNFLALLAEACELFGEGDGDRIEIVLEPPKAAAGSEARAFT